MPFTFKHDSLKRKKDISVKFLRQKKEKDLKEYVDLLRCLNTYIMCHGSVFLHIVSKKPSGMISELRRVSRGFP